MANKIAFARLRLDTTGPIGQLVLGNGSGFSADEDILFRISVDAASSDAVSYKIWGGLDDGSGNIVEVQESAAQWKSLNLFEDPSSGLFEYEGVIKLTNEDGLKEIFIRLVDDVGNESAIISKQIYLDRTPAEIDIIGLPDPDKISKIDTFNISTMSWVSSEDLVEYKIMVVPSEGSLHDVGTQIGTTFDSEFVYGEGTVETPVVAADTPITTTITGADLEAACLGDGEKIIKVFGKNKAGLWSV